MADDEKRTTSAAKDLATDHPPNSLDQTGSLGPNFQDKADPYYTAQVEAMNQSDTEKAQGTGEGSQMISEEANRNNMSAPEHMRDGVDDKVFEERRIADGIAKELDRPKDDLYRDQPNSDYNKEEWLNKYEESNKFDNSHDNDPDYNNDM